jgi:regulator of protease activity HflC (stomatin/prohibitin superfamily)
MQERLAWKMNGFLGLLLMLVSTVLGGWLVSVGNALGIVCFLLLLVIGSGMTVVQPNQGKVVTFFGQYLGSVVEPGFWWTVPFSARKKISLRVRNFNSAKLKVNDVDGNPIEIAAVIVFKVVDTAKAVFSVEKYEEFVEIQSETALRHIASYYPYDNFEEAGISLRGNSDEVAAELQNDLQKRLSLAGVEVMEARLTHLAYAPEIAHAMLQRQQANAILAARQKIVEGAVSMVQMAIQKMESDGIVTLDEERKAAMINNLMVSIVSERSAQPVVNAGSLY